MTEGTASDLAAPEVLAVPGTIAEFRDANFQWYIARARNTVYFAAYSPLRWTPEMFLKMVTDIFTLAPQLNLRHDDRRQAHIDARPFSWDDITTYNEVPSFDGFPDKVLGPNEDLFEHPMLPNFRAACYVLPEGKADAAGNRTMVHYRASHALMEGIDTAQVLRGRPSDHRAKKSPEKQLWDRFWANFLGVVALPSNYVITAIAWRYRNKMGLRTVKFSRALLKRVAAELGVQQRSVLFAIVMYGIYHGAAGGRRPLKRRRIIGYSNLTPQRFGGDDEFVRLRMQVAIQPHRDDFASYVRALDKRLTTAGNRSLGLQRHYNVIMGIHRRIERFLPFLYGRRFFAFVPYDFVLSLVPPHAPGGVFASLGLNTVYCGSHTPGVNCCVIVPQGDVVTLNVYGAEPLLDRMGGIETLLSELADPPPAMAAISARSAGDAKSLSH